jgi:hypothetical protein
MPQSVCKQTDHMSQQHASMKACVCAISWVCVQIDIVRLAITLPDVYYSWQRSPAAMCSAVSYLCTSLQPSNAANPDALPLHVYLRPAAGLGQCCITSTDFAEALNAASQADTTMMSVVGQLTKLGEPHTFTHANIHKCTGCRCVPLASMHQHNTDECSDC